MRRFRQASVVLMALLLPGVLAAQSSVFGTRVLGLPVLPLSAKAQGMGGGNALFDPEVSLNPASLWSTQRTTASFSVRHFWRDSENQFGSTTGNDTQFPLAMVAGPIGSRWDFGVSVSAYTDRTFALALSDTLILRDEPVAVSDTMISKGGTSDIRGAVSYTVSSRLALGVAFHYITGTNRIDYHRRFADSAYAPVLLRNELSVAGPGFSAGFSVQPLARIRLAGMVRWDSDLNYYKDSTRLDSDVPMPITLAGGVQIQAGSRLLLAGQAIARNWSVADEFVVSQGGIGARDTFEGSVGLEWIRNSSRRSSFPLRLGMRYAQLPFPVVAGQEGKELQLSLGTGFRFTAERGSLDIAIEQTWREDAVSFKEQTFMLTVGVGIRP